MKFPFGQNVSKLVFDVDVFDLDLRIQINSIEQPIKSNSVSPGNMSHCRTPSFDNHFDHCFVVFKHIQQSLLARGWTFEGTESILSITLIFP